LLGATVDGDSPELCDTLLRAVGNLGKSSWRSLQMGAQPSDRVAIERLRDGGAIVASSIASHTSSQAVLEHIVAKDRRLAVRRAVLTNEHLSDAGHRAVLLEALGKDDIETVTEVARHSPPYQVFLATRDLELSGPMEQRLAVAFHRVSDRDEVLEVLAGPHGRFAGAVLTQTANGTVEGLDTDEALLVANLDDMDKATALSQSFAVLSADQARPMADARWQSSHMNRYHLPCRFSVDAALSLYPHAGAELRRHLLQGCSDRSTELVDLAAASGKPEELDICCNAVADSEEADVGHLLGHVLALLERQRAVSPVNRYQVRWTWTLPSAERLLEAGLLDTDQALALLRHGHLGLTLEWLAGKFRCTPGNGDLGVLLDEPGWAFTDLASQEPVRGTAVRERLNAVSSPLGRAISKPWGAELAEATAGLVGSLASQAATDEVVSWVMGRLRESFGDDARLWEQMLSLAPGFPGTLSELVQVTSVTCGRPLAAAGAPSDTGRHDEVQRSLF